MDGSQRFEEFAAWLTLAVSPMKTDVKRVVIAGHSNWYKLFVGWMMDHYDLHGNCSEFASKKLKNQAMAVIASEGSKTTCRCVFDGITTEGPLACT